MASERELQISPIVPESVIHNTKALTQLRNLTASLFGIGAGILGLESYPGFLFYLFFSLLTTAMIYAFRVAGKGKGVGKRAEEGLHGGKTYGDVQVFFRSAWELWTGGLVDGLSGFVLTWTLAYGLVRA